MEIERKFLLRQVPFALVEYRAINIIQGYISTNPTIRVRRADDDYILTVKGVGDLAKEEFELNLDYEQFESLWNKIDQKTKPIHKTRYLIPLENNLVAELDIYYGKFDGLITVEVEFESVEQANAFLPPDWFGEDVTKDKRYSNSSLSMNFIDNE